MNVRTHARQFRHVHVAVFKDRFGQHAGPIGPQQHCHKLRLHVRRKARERRCRQGQRAQLAVGGDSDAALMLGDFNTRFAQCGKRRVHVIGVGAIQFHRPAGQTDGTGIAARFDTVRHDSVGCAMQTVDTFNDKLFGTNALNMRAHGDQQVAQVDNFRLPRGVFKDAGALGADGRHQRIFGCPDRDDREHDGPARQAATLGAGCHVTSGRFNLCAKGFECLQMQIDRAVANGAATWQRHSRFPRTGQQRPKDEDGGAHLPHDIIRRHRRGDVARAQRHDPTKIFRPCAFNHGRTTQLVEQMAKAVNVGQTRQVPER